MNELIRKYLDRANSAIDTAHDMLIHEHNLALANRAYYSIFYCICALLLTENITTKKHEGARVKFHELFVKTGRFPISSGQILERSFETRQLADYDIDTEISDEQARQLLSDARTFYTLTMEYLIEE